MQKKIYYIIYVNKTNNNVTFNDLRFQCKTADLRIGIRQRQHEFLNQTGQYRLHQLLLVGPRRNMFVDALEQRLEYLHGAHPRLGAVHLVRLEYPIDLRHNGRTNHHDLRIQIVGELDQHLHGSVHRVLIAAQTLDNDVEQLGPRIRPVHRGNVRDAKRHGRSDFAIRIVQAVGQNIANHALRLIRGHGYRFVFERIPVVFDVSSQHYGGQLPERQIEGLVHDQFGQIYAITYKFIQTYIFII